ncbi:DoxX family protein [Mucilaginibacter agri]|uniref:DoxX family protein n=1 Tax=Mucilaginibacter agri TaxID=2695265 RepID=A0A965ZLY3_9SPHI|nr:DoxX family protein [Mucilaginibacter agri]NCD72121.1 DoxX family protein [Mucilaginibacter agri]
MTVTSSKFPQLYFRLALSIGFFLPVADRLGLLGPAGQHAVSWGNWENFAAYTNTLMPFLSRGTASFMGVLATICEVSIALAFLIGFKVKAAAIGSFLLTLIFAICMFIFSDPKVPFYYSVFADSAGSLLLACVPAYYWSLDNYLSKKRRR